MQQFYERNMLGRTHKLVAALILLLFVTHHYASAVTVTPRLEASTDPGTTAREIFKITNEERQSRTYYLAFENFQSVDESGNPTFTGGFEDLATWIKAPSSITVGPLDSAEVPISIEVPLNAEPGGHFAAIFLVTDPPESRNPGDVSLSAKLGTLVLLRVGGEFDQGGNILEFGTGDGRKFFNSLPVDFYYRFQNSGEDHIKPLGDVQIKNTFGGTSKILPANPVDGSVLPKSVRKFETVWAQSGKPLKQSVETPIPEPPKGYFANVKYQLTNFAFGKYSARLKLAYGTPDLKSVNATYTFFVLPWQLITFVLGLLLIIFIAFRIFIRRYNRYIIERAGVNVKRKRNVQK